MHSGRMYVRLLNIVTSKRLLWAVCASSVVNTGIDHTNVLNVVHTVVLTLTLLVALSMTQGACDGRGGSGKQACSYVAHHDQPLYMKRVIGFTHPKRKFDHDSSETSESEFSTNSGHICASFSFANSRNKLSCRITTLLFSKLPFCNFRLFLNAIWSSS